MTYGLELRSPPPPRQRVLNIPSAVSIDASLVHHAARGLVHQLLPARALLAAVGPRAAHTELGEVGRRVLLERRGVRRAVALPQALQLAEARSR
eukprot:CAMPEP_0205885358 /NCGR_PEP_ID=MMETSP1083-20121108/18624_1 /ASSEMBLY_ACC=CAM_ASM_000430 /TAXON_ID=97485 /ORGANISM="Prymnesium parvum, Strain Texoma1" /LENGTH=93 /DNA_ID=CAMNT_0053248851 /DNA_START=153 /DNA_END=431 /DNA_ORIENTATION=+